MTERAPRPNGFGPDQRIELTGHDSDWRAKFDEESIRLSHALVISGARIAHVGSTAVQGLAAAPSIDVMIGVDRYPPTPAFFEPLAELGYVAGGERGLPGRLLFMKRADSAFDVHLTQFRGPVWRDALMLRDYLAADAAAAARYGQRKREILAAAQARLEDYARLKTALLAQLLDDARRWKPGEAALRQSG